MKLYEWILSSYEMIYIRNGVYQPTKYDPLSNFMVIALFS